MRLNKYILWVFLMVFSSLCVLSLAEQPTVEIWLEADKGPGELSDDTDDVIGWTAPPTTAFITDFLGFKGPLEGYFPYYSRTTAWLSPPQSGEYTFYLTSDGGSRLYLSSDDDVANLTEICRVYDWTYSFEWDAFWGDEPAMVSLPIYLDAEGYYALTVTHAAVTWGNHDHLGVSWAGPGIHKIAPVAQPFLLSSHPQQARALWPVNGAENVMSGSASWEVFPSNEPTEYRVYRAVDPDEPDTVVDFGWTHDTTFNLGGYPHDLVPGHTYAWRVDVKYVDNDVPVIYEGDWWFFTMGFVPPVFVEQPKDTAAPAGTTAFFTAEADGFGADVNYTWYQVVPDTEHITNGSFEQPPATQGWPLNPGAGQGPVEIDGWTIDGDLWQIWMHNKTGRNIFFPDYKESIPDGDQCVVIQHHRPGGVVVASQDIAGLDHGQYYDLSFYAVQRQSGDWGDGGTSLQVELGTQVLMDMFAPPRLDQLGAPADNPVWPHYTVGFTYDEAWGNELKFVSESSAQGSSYFLDGVSFVPYIPRGNNSVLEVIADEELDGTYFFCEAANGGYTTKSEMVSLTVLTGCVHRPLADLSGDCRVGIEDLLLMAFEWLTTGIVHGDCVDRPAADFIGDCRVGLQDLAILAREWLSCGWYPQTECYP